MSVEGKAGNGLVNETTGVIKARRVLNNLHAQLGDAGFNEVEVTFLVILQCNGNGIHIIVTLFALFRFTWIKWNPI